MTRSHNTFVTLNIVAPSFMERAPLRRNDRLCGDGDGDVGGRKTAVRHAKVTARGDADQRERLAVDANRLPNHARVAAERPLPQAVADHRCGLRVRTIVPFVETPPEVHRHAHGREVIAGHEHAAAHRRLPAQRDVRLSEEREREDIRLGPATADRSAV